MNQCFCGHEASGTVLFIRGNQSTIQEVCDTHLNLFILNLETVMETDSPAKRFPGPEPITVEEAQLVHQILTQN